MPLPQIIHTGPGYSDVRELLRDLHAGVLELGVGKCEVIFRDDPERRETGWQLSVQRGGYIQWWDFMIHVDNLRKDGAAYEYLRIAAKRAEVARLLETGADPATFLAPSTL